MTGLIHTFGALADDTRFCLVEHLIAQGEQPAGALTKVVPISAPAVSRHLKVLREAGLVDQRVSGTHRYYRVNPEALRAISAWTISHKDFWQGSLDRLEKAISREQRKDR